jgi:hypothetical protein
MDDPLAAKMAEGMRSTSTLVCFFGYFLCTSKESNSLQQERNERLFTRENNDKLTRITATAKTYTHDQLLFTARRQIHVVASDAVKAGISPPDTI